MEPDHVVFLLVAIVIAVAGAGFVAISCMMAMPEQLTPEERAKKKRRKEERNARYAASFMTERATEARLAAESAEEDARAATALVEKYRKQE